jgi:hypothetical protein
MRCPGVGAALDLDGILMDHLVVLRGVAFVIGDIPAQGFEEDVEELLAKLCFVIGG